MWHIAAFSGAAGSAAPVLLAGLQDPVLTQSPQGPGYQFQQQYRLIAAAAISATLVRAQLTSPQLRQIQIPDIKPIVAGTAWPSPFFIDWKMDQPLVLPKLEQISPLVTVTAAGPETATVLIWLGGTMDPIPAGPILRAHATSTGTAVAGAWTNITLTFDQSLPSGLYYVAASQHVSATALAHRIVYPISPGSSLMRPGNYSNQAFTDIIDPRISAHMLGGMGSFLNTAPPTMDVLCVAADNAHDFWLDLIPISGQLNTAQGL